MSYEYRKPITDEEREKFLHTYQGLEIVETEMYLFALEPNEMMGTKDIEMTVLDYDEEGIVIGDHTAIVTIPYPVINPNYEQERVGKLQCTKRVFVLILEQLGFDYFEQLKPVIEANRQASSEWELCERLERKNPLLDQLALQFGVSSKQLDDLFKFANGEITQEEFLNNNQ